MPRRAGRVCRVPGCPNVTVGSDCCEAHSAAAQQRDQRLSSARRGYGHRWRQLRQMVLARNPLCADPFELHGSIGEVVEATDLHHIVPLATEGVSTRILNSEENLMPLCHSCHSRITATSSGAEALTAGGVAQ